MKIGDVCVESDVNLKASPSMAEKLRRQLYDGPADIRRGETTAFAKINGPAEWDGRFYKRIGF